MRIYGVAAIDPVGQVIAEIERVCGERGLTLSRWQTNDKGAGHVRRITYLAHHGTRAGQARYQKNVVARAVLDNREGRTERSEAYRELQGMLESLEDKT
jgi:hypothetical protein